MGCELSDDSGEFNFKSNSFEMFLEDAKETLGIDDGIITSLIISNSISCVSEDAMYKKFDKDMGKVIIEKLKRFQDMGSTCSMSRISRSFFN